MEILTTFTLSISEMLGILGILSMIIGVWIDARIRISALEIKMKTLTNELNQHCEENDTKYAQMIVEIKELAKEIHKAQLQQNNNVHELKMLIAQIRKDKMV